jgi:hypothetical protein
MGKNPGNIRKMFTSPLPLKRNRAIKNNLTLLKKLMKLKHTCCKNENIVYNNYQNWGDKFKRN